MAYPEFIGAVTVKRSQLMNGGVKAFTSFLKNFLRMTHFDTPWGKKRLNELMEYHKVMPNEDSLSAFLMKASGEYLGLMAYKTGENDYDFRLVSGSLEEIKRMQ